MDNRQLDLCNFEQSQKLKELGFDIPCRTYWFRNLEKNWFEDEDDVDLCYTADWGNNILRPTVELALKWLRDNHKLFVGVTRASGKSWLEVTNDSTQVNLSALGLSYYTDEEAKSAGLNFLLNLKAKGNG